MSNCWPYNTARWQRLRKVVLGAEPLCRYCTEAGRTTLATVVDHIKPWRAGGEVWALDNLQALCTTCHNSVKQREEKLGERVGCDVNGIPLKGWE